MNKLLYFDPKQKKGYELSQANSLFTKYFPKYQRHFSLIKNNGAIKSKIKRVKILKDFQHVGLHQNRSGWRVLLANKIKTIKALDSHANYAKEFAEKVKSFINLKSIRIFMPDFSTDFPELVEQRVKAVRKIFENMRSLKNLKHLEVTPISKDTNNYFSKLNSSPRLLSSLKMFKVGFDWRRTQNLDLEVSEQIEGNKNLLKSVNFLALGPLERPCHFKILRHLSREICPKITELFFEMSCRIYLKSPIQSKYSDRREKVNINYLENLIAFQNLKNLHIDIADTFTFLRDIVLPNSVQSLRFEFIENLTEQILLKIDHNFADSKSELPTFFEENHFLLRFYENFRELGHLENLHIAFSLESHDETYKYQSYLLQSWLKRVPASLKHLKLLANKKSLGFNGFYVPEVLDFYLPEILESCENFAQTLKTLELGSSKVVYKRFDLSTLQNKFASLSSLKVNGRFIQDEDSDIDTLGLFLKQVVSIGDSITHIELVISMNMRTESLLSLLRRMRQLQELKRLEIELKVFFTPGADLDPADFSDGINELKNNQEYDRKVESTLVEFHAIPDDGLFMEFLILFCEKAESKSVKR